MAPSPAATWSPATRCASCSTPAASTGTATTCVLCIGIAARGDGHVPILAQLAELLMEPDRADALRSAATPDEVLMLLTPDAPALDVPTDWRTDPRTRPT